MKIAKEQLRIAFFLRMKLVILAAAIGICFGSISVVGAQEEPAGGPAVAAPAEDEALLEEAEVNRDEIISEILATWGPSPQLEMQLPHATTEELLNALAANTVEELDTALLGSEAGGPEVLDGPLFVGQSSRDWSYTGVSPCRIVDTRFQTSGGTGPIPSGGTREFFVYGFVGNQNGGPGVGNPNVCNSPVGEPRAVHINVTVVPVFGPGNVRVYPANIGTPNASLVNYQVGTNIANAATIQTFFSIGPREIEVFASQRAHVIIDVLGYYINPAESDGVDWANAATIIALGNNTTVETITVTSPTSGYVVVTASGNFRGTQFAGKDIARCSITTIRH